MIFSFEFSLPLLDYCSIALWSEFILCLHMWEQPYTLLSITEVLNVGSFFLLGVELDWIFSNLNLLTSLDFFSVAWWSCVLNCAQPHPNSSFYHIFHGLPSGMQQRTLVHTAWLACASGPAPTMLFYKHFQAWPTVPTFCWFNAREQTQQPAFCLQIIQTNGICKKR